MLCLAIPKEMEGWFYDLVNCCKKCVFLKVRIMFEVRIFESTYLLFRSKTNMSTIQIPFQDVEALIRENGRIIKRLELLHEINRKQPQHTHRIQVLTRRLRHNLKKLSRWVDLPQHEKAISLSSLQNLERNVVVPPKRPVSQPAPVSQSYRQIPQQNTYANFLNPAMTSNQLALSE